MRKKETLKTKQAVFLVSIADCSHKMAVISIMVANRHPALWQCWLKGKTLLYFCNSGSFAKVWKTTQAVTFKWEKIGWSGTIDIHAYHELETAGTLSSLSILKPRKKTLLDSQHLQAEMTFAVGHIGSQISLQLFPDWHWVCFFSVLVFILIMAWYVAIWDVLTCYILSDRFGLGLAAMNLRVPENLVNHS